MKAALKILNILLGILVTISVMGVLGYALYRISTIQETETGLQRHIKEQTDKISTVTKENESALAANKKLAKDLKETKAELQNYKKDRDNLFFQSKRILQENEVMKKDMKTLREQAEKFKKENAVMKASAGDLMGTKEKLADENVKLAEEIKDYAELKKDLGSIDKLKQELNRTAEENIQLKKMLSRLKDLEEKETSRVALEEEIKLVRKENENLKKRLENAVSEYQEMSKRYQKFGKENADMHYNLGVLFMENKKVENAAKEFEKVIDVRPNDADAHYNLGILYDEFIRDRQRALDHYRTFLKLSPNGDDAKRVQQFIIALETKEASK